MEYTHCSHCGEGEGYMIPLKVGRWICTLCGEFTEISLRIDRIDGEEK